MATRQPEFVALRIDLTRAGETLLLLRRHGHLDGARDRADLAYEIGLAGHRPVVLTLPKRNTRTTRGRVPAREPRN
jgi:hypothetical protein